MGTHPIFESDFDCLTERKMLGQVMIGQMVKQSTRTIRRLPGMLPQWDPDGPRGRGQHENMYIDRHVVRFHPDTAYPREYSKDHGVRHRSKICGNGWVFQKRAGINQKQYRKNVSGEEFIKHQNRTHCSSNNLHTIVHKLSNPEYVRQRWTVSDPFKGYNKESHYWYVPEDIKVRKAKADTFVKQRDMYTRKLMWPVASPSGRPLQQQERRSDGAINQNPKRIDYQDR